MGRELPIGGECRHTCAIRFFLRTLEHPLGLTVSGAQGYKDSGLSSAQSRDRTTEPEVRGRASLGTGDEHSLPGAGKTSERRSVGDMSV